MKVHRHVSCKQVFKAAQQVAQQTTYDNIRHFGSTTAQKTRNRIFHILWSCIHGNTKRREI